MSITKTEDEVNKILFSYGYIKIGSYNGARKPIKCQDPEGYIVYPILYKLYNGTRPLRFHCSNPNTIDNIKHYIDINNIDASIISNTYVDSRSDLIFQCACTRLFNVSWNNFSAKSKHKCNECTLGRPTHIVPYEDVITLTKRANLIPLFSKDTYTNIGSGSAIVQNDCGYKAVLTYQFIEQGKAPEWFHKSNPYTIDNINVFLNTTTKGEYVCVSTCYNGRDCDLEVLHKTCGETFHTTWGNLNRHPSEKEPSRTGTKCPYCTGLRTQSLHAVVLKQLFQKLKNGTVVEDKSCINPTTNCVLPTDIVNHNDKIAIEIQSWFHDRPEQQIKDKIKKDYWESRGYTVYTPDIRKYSVLEMAQIFFTELKTIPEWVKYNFEEKLNVDVAQELLNKGLLVSEVALEIGVSKHRIYDAIYSKKLVYPYNYKNKKITKMKYINQQETVQTAGCV